MCKILRVSRSSYYHWLGDPQGKRKRKYMELDGKIKEAYLAAEGRKSSPRLSIDLQAGGTPVSRPTVARHMKQMGLPGKPPKRFKAA
jgi:putative transposase